MNVLVTGGAGYIGSHTAKALARAGHIPIVYDSLETGYREAVKWGPLIEADLADRNRLAEAFALHRIDAVIHFAAYIAVGESVQKPEKYFRNNVGGTLCLLEAMRDAGVRHIVFSSTAAVYGMPEKSPIPEEHATHPINPYGESKLMVENLLDACGVVSAKLRYFNAAGADLEGETGERHDPETHLIPLALAAASGDRPYLELYGTDYLTADGTAVRDYIHVTDLADAHLLALGHIRSENASVILNLGTGEGATVRQVLQTVESVTGRKVPVVEKPRRAGDAVELVADSRRARQLLRWTPQHSSLQEIIQTAWAWYV